MPSSRQSAATEVSRWAMAAWASRTWAFDSAKVRPPLRPRARAAVSPARVRSRISSRSNSARAAKMPNTRRPPAVVVSILRSVLALMGADLDAPDHTTLSRRSQPLAVMLRRIPAMGPIHLIVDSTGLSIVGQGAWAAAKHGGHGKRGWKKLHLGVDRSGVIVAQALTDAHVDDATTAVDLIPAVDGDISSVTADAAYDTIAVYEAAGARGARVVVPPQRTAAVSRRSGSAQRYDMAVDDVFSS